MDVFKIGSNVFFSLIWVGMAFWLYRVAKPHKASQPDKWKRFRIWLWGGLAIMIALTWIPTSGLTDPIYIIGLVVALVLAIKVFGVAGRLGIRF